MKRKLSALVLAASLLLSGCSSLLEREYSQITPHNTAPTAEGDPSTLRADSYQELVNALLYFVTIGAESGAVRLYIDSQEVEADLDAACLEVVQEDPLGAYSVEFIKYSVDPVVTYCQADVQITYRRTREQVASIVSATGVTAIRSELRSALTSFAPERVLRISYFNEGEEFIRSLVRQAYYTSPASALDMPGVAVSIYPKTGRQRIVEIGLSYHLEEAELKQRKERLARTLYDLSWSLPEEARGDGLISAAAQGVLDAGGYDPEGGSTAYHALLEGGADSEGLALAMAALCELLEIPCRVVEGTLEGETRFWNVVSAQAGWRHLDLSRLSGGEGPLDPEWEEAPFGLDQELAQAGYAWDTAAVPRCGPSAGPGGPEEAPHD